MKGPNKKVKGGTETTIQAEFLSNLKLIGDITIVVAILYTALVLLDSVSITRAISNVIGSGIVMTICFVTWCIIKYCRNNADAWRVKLAHRVKVFSSLVALALLAIVLFTQPFDVAINVVYVIASIGISFGFMMVALAWVWKWIMASTIQPVIKEMPVVPVKTKPLNDKKFKETVKEVVEEPLEDGKTREQIEKEKAIEEAEAAAAALAAEDRAKADENAKKVAENTKKALKNAEDTEKAVTKAVTDAMKLFVDKADKNLYKMSQDEVNKLADQCCDEIIESIEDPEIKRLVKERVTESEIEITKPKKGQIEPDGNFEEKEKPAPAPTPIGASKNPKPLSKMERKKLEERARRGKK